jgi:hypothetical protein
MAKIIRENDALMSIYYDSSLEFFEERFEFTNSSNRNWHDRILRGQERGQRWFGPYNEEANDVLTKSVIGDAYLYKNLQDKIRQIDERTGKFHAEHELQVVQRKRRKPVRAAFGDEIDIHRVYAGDLENAWRKTVHIQEEKHFHLVHVMINTVYSASENCVNTLWNAAATVKIVSDLEAAGKSVAVTVLFPTTATFKESRKGLCVAMNIKKYNERLTPERLAAMTHAGFMRSWGFLGGLRQNRYTIGYGYGMPTQNLKTYSPINIQEEIKEGITKPIYIRANNSIDSAVHAIESAKQQMHSDASSAQ